MPDPLTPTPDTEEPPAKKRLGFLAGQISVPADIDQMFADEIEEMFGLAQPGEP